jgi:hypothetical protein
VGWSKYRATVQRRRLVVLVADVRVGTQREERLGESDVALLGGDVQRGMPRHVAGDVAATEAVDVEAGLDEQLGPNC